MNTESLQEDYVGLLDTANKWMFRAKAAFTLCEYFNKISYPGSSSWTHEDLKKEIESQADRLMKMHKDGITFINEKIPEDFNG
jgi:hypothetical protein